MMKKLLIAPIAAAALIENGYRVLFTRTNDLVQRLQQARQALSLESAIEKLDKYHVLILEDLCYVRKDQAETSVLFQAGGQNDREGHRLGQGRRQRERRCGARPGARRKP
jgi:hypothetical protein